MEGADGTGLVRASQSESKAPAFSMLSKRRFCLSFGGSVKCLLPVECVAALETSAIEVSEGWRHPLSCVVMGSVKGSWLSTGIFEGCKAPRIDGGVGRLVTTDRRGEWAWISTPSPSCRGEAFWL